MRVMMRVSIPVAAGNKAIADGSLPKTILSWIEQYKPEAAYFAADGGNRTGYFVLDLKEPSAIPSICEPFFLKLDAAIELKPVMNVEDMKTGVARAMGKP